MEALREIEQRGELCLTSEDRLGHLSRQPAVAVDEQTVGPILVETDHCGEPMRKQRKAASDETGISAVPAHGRDKRARAGSNMNTVIDHFVRRGDWQPSKQRHAFTHSRFEFNFASHCPLRDGRDLLLYTQVVGKLVDAFLTDHGGIHVGKKELLAPARCGLDHNVDWGTAERRADRFGVRTKVAIRRRKGNIGCDTGGEPDWTGVCRHGVLRAFERAIIECSRPRAGDQSHDEGHEMAARAASMRAVLIAGPTASGKSALALEIAEALGGAIINADSMQVYRDLRIITARPSPEDGVRVAHLLYGHVDAAENYSTGRWCVDASSALRSAEKTGRLPIVVGGTGLYFKALTRGLAEIPPVPMELRLALRRRLQEEGPAPLYAELRERDPDTAQRLMPRDRTRITRALEVALATGRSLTEWHRDGMKPPIEPHQAVRIFLDVNREELYGRIAVRFDGMLAAGALDEVRALHKRGLDPALPAMKAHGVPWLIRHLEEEIDLPTAAEGSKRDTRRYTKRQATWFRHQLPDWTWVAPEAALAAIRRALGRSAGR